MAVELHTNDLDALAEIALESQDHTCNTTADYCCKDMEVVVVYPVDIIWHWKCYGLGRVSSSSLVVSLQSHPRYPSHQL